MKPIPPPEQPAPIPSAFAPFENLAVGIFGFSSKGELIYVDQKGCGLFGCAKKDLLKRPCAEIASDLVASNWGAFWSELKKCGALEGQGQLLVENETPVPVDFRALYVSSAGTGYCCTFVKKTGSMANARIAVEAHRQQLVQLLNGLDDSAFVMDEQLRIIFLNERACLFLHTVNSEAAGKTLHDFFGGPQAGYISAKARQVFDSQLPGILSPGDSEPMPAGIRSGTMFPYSDQATSKRYVLALLNNSRAHAGELQPIARAFRGTPPELTPSPIAALHRSISEGPVYFFVKDTNNAILWMSESFFELYGLASNDILGRPLEDLADTQIRASEWRNQDEEIIRTEKPLLNLVEKIELEGRGYFRTDKFPLFDKGGSVCGILGYTVEIPAVPGSEKKSLDQVDPALDISRTLEEMKKAVHSLAREGGKSRTGEDMDYYEKVRKTILPYVLNLKDAVSDPSQRKVLDLMESSLKRLTDPYTEKITSPVFSLSPTEVQVAQFIKDGKTNKEIAALMNLSKSTILTHRHHIRSKLGLKNQKKNLRTYLQSI